MAGKTLKELLSKYTPPQEYARLLELADNVLSRVDKANRILEVRADFPYLVEKDTLYSMEEQVAEIYQLAHFKILPHYPAELFENIVPTVRHWISDLSCREFSVEGFDPQWWLFLKK